MGFEGDVNCVCQSPVLLQELMLTHEHTHGTRGFIYDPAAVPSSSDPDMCRSDPGFCFTRFPEQ